MMTRKFLWALLPVAAVLLMTACGGDDTDDVTPTPTPNPVTPGTENVVKSVPYTVTVNTGNTTRTSVDNDGETLRFEKDDNLYVQSDDGTVYGCLSLKNGAYQTSATFAGYVNYTGTPAPETELTATLVGKDNKLDLIGNDGKVKDNATYKFVHYNTLEDAVREYSLIRGKGTYGGATFTLAQETAFMKFDVTIQDGTEGGVEVPVKIANDGSKDYLYNFTMKTTGSKYNAKISFVLPFRKGDTVGRDASMCVANVGDDDERIRIGTGSDIPLEGGKVYPVTRTKDFVRLWKEGPVWRTRNLGASEVTDAGDYYAWGETTPQAYTAGTGFTESSYSYHDNPSTLPVTADAAYQNLGAKWRMPTLDEQSALVSNTNTTSGWETGGATLTGKNDYSGKVIFLPAAGNWDHTGKVGANMGLYWSSSRQSETQARGIYFIMTSIPPTTTDAGNRYCGLSIRPVRIAY